MFMIFGFGALLMVVGGEGGGAPFFAQIGFDFIERGCEL